MLIHTRSDTFARVCVLVCVSVSVSVCAYVCGWVWVCACPFITVSIQMSVCAIPSRFLFRISILIKAKLLFFLLSLSLSLSLSLCLSPSVYPQGEDSLHHTSEHGHIVRFVRVCTLLLCGWTHQLAGENCGNCRSEFVVL